MSALKVRTHAVRFEPIGRLQVVQVQPSGANFDDIDYAARRKVFGAIQSWASEPPAPPTSLEDVASLSAEVMPRPEPPRVLLFPELYTPISEFENLLDRRLQGQQVICSGVIPEPEDSEGSPFFSAQAVARLLSSRHVETIGNRAFLERLHARLRTHGNKANLAATLAVDRRARPVLLLHAKVVPSKYEQRHRFGENTVCADEVHILKLSWSRPRGSYFLLPLICSDFALRDEMTGELLLRRIAEEHDRVDLICVLSVQPCRSDGHPPWPREYQLAALDVAEHRIGPSLDRAHTTMTNVASYTSDAKPHDAGYSFMTLQNGPNWVPYSKPPSWDGVCWYFGKFSTSNTNLLPGYCWVRKCSAGWNPTHRLEKQVGILLTHDTSHTSRAIIQHFEISPNNHGEPAWQSGRLLALSSNWEIEGYYG